MQATQASTSQAPLKSFLYLETLIASLLPVIAILIVGVAGTEQMVNTDIRLFVLVFSFCACVIFCCEFALIRFMQQMLRKQSSREVTASQDYSEFIAVCEDYVAGNTQKRIAVYEKNKSQEKLARALNALLDLASQKQRPSATQEAKDVGRDGAAPATSDLLNKQIKQLIQEISAVKDGDLRVRAQVNPGDIGVIASICNHLIEQLVQVVLGVRWASDDIVDATSNLLEHYIKLAQTTETQVQHLSHITEVAEKIVTYIQRLNSALHVSIEIAQGKAHR
jgi:methyl-accepting chemotaxis protein